MGNGHRPVDTATRKHRSHNAQVGTECVDIDILITDMHRLQTLVKPFVRLGHLLHKLRRWESTQLCVMLLTLINVACLIFPTSYYLLLQLVFIGFCATVGVSHIKYRLLSKVIPNAYVSRSEEDRSHAQLMHDFRVFLVHANTFLKKTNNLFLNFYSILKWDNSKSSTRFYLLVSFMLLLGNLLSLRYFLTILLNAFFLQVPVQRYVTAKCEEKVKKHRARLEKQKSESAMSRVSFAVTPTSEEDTISLSQMSQLSVSEAGDALDESDLDASDKFESGSSGSDFSDDDNDSLNMEPGGGGERGAKVKDTAGRGMMSRIIEFKKRQQQAGTGACLGCGGNFSSILKRRRTCVYCGNHYCSKCCCTKIPKTYFGATAPNAQNETVLVCSHCHQFLTAGGGGGGGSVPLAEKTKAQ